MMDGDMIANIPIARHRRPTNDRSTIIIFNNTLLIVNTKNIQQDGPRPTLHVCMICMKSVHAMYPVQCEVSNAAMRVSPMYIIPEASI